MLDKLTTSQKILGAILIVAVMYFIYDYFLSSGPTTPPDIATHVVIPSKDRGNRSATNNGNTNKVASNTNSTAAVQEAGEDWFPNFAYSRWDKDPFFYPTRVKPAPSTVTQHDSVRRQPRKVKQPFNPSIYKLSAISRRAGTAFVLINNEVLSLGDEIQGAKLVEIRKNSVIMEYAGKRYTISMASIE